MTYSPPVRLTLAEFQAKVSAQGMTERQDFAFRCPVCRTIQSGRDLIAAGVGSTFEEVENVLGFSCVGRYTGAGPHKRKTPPGRGCNWSLAGLLRVHQLEVVDADGKVHPIFEPVTPAEAEAHATRSRRAKARES